MHIPCEFLILAAAPENITESEFELSEFLSEFGIVPAHTLREIIGGIAAKKHETSDHDCAYINAPDCAPYSDGFIPCGIAGYTADLSRADSGFEFGSIAIVIQHQNDSLIVAVFKSA